ncbi:kinase-like domain-containing protein [Hypoxylon fuscum]|nr:kinase-like domain-containing protein [Hypoxylon fuscum]
MATYTHPKLPYFAPEEQLPAPLPTFEEIVSSKDNLRYYDEFIHWRKLVRVGEHFVAKFGCPRLVKLEEGENMLLVKNNTKVRVPTVYAIYQEPYKGCVCNFIVMEYIAGDKLEIQDLMMGERLAVTMQLRAYLNELRSIPSPGYYGVPGREPIPVSEKASDAIFQRLAPPAPYYDPKAPFELFASFKEMWTFARSQFWRPSDESNVAVFTHGALRPDNIIIQPNGTICLLGWKSALFGPAYLEYVCAMPQDPEHKEDWVDMIPIFLDSYKERLSMIRNFRKEYENQEDYYYDNFYPEDEGDYGYDDSDDLGYNSYYSEDEDDSEDENDSSEHDDDSV